MLQFFLDHIYIASLTAFALLLLLTLEWRERRGGGQVDAAEATRLINQSKGLVVDIRPKNMFTQGHIAGAINMPLAELADKVKTLKAHQHKPLIVVCQKGISAVQGAEALRASGFEQVVVLEGGMTGWLGAHYPVVQSDSASSRASSSA